MHFKLFPFLTYCISGMPDMGGMGAGETPSSAGGAGPTIEEVD